MAEIKAIISDFDGTLVDTFEANYLAYRQAFAEIGYTLIRETYRACFGLRYDKFVEQIGMTLNDDTRRVRNLKAQFYPQYFAYLIPNKPLIEFIRAYNSAGGKTAIASTARRENLMAALKCIDAENLFDVILAGDVVEHGKPHPEIYLKALDMLQVGADEAICFEDTDVGIAAAKAAGLPVIRIDKSFYGDRSNR